MNKDLEIMALVLGIITSIIFIWIFVTAKKEDTIYNGNGTEPDPWDPENPCANIPSGMGVAVWNPDTNRYVTITCP